MFEKLRGVRDFYPEDFHGRKVIYGNLSGTAKNYGFKEVCTPSIESLDIFTKKSGEAIVDEIYSFNDKGGRGICLIPELTPSVVRMVVQRQKVLTKPVKWFSLSRHWRYERPQKGRQREFYQFNVDIFGSRSSRADFEILSCGIDCLLNLGIDNFMFHLSDRNILGAFFESLHLPVNEAFTVVDKRNKVDEPEFRSMLSDMGMDDEGYDSLIGLLDINGNVNDCADLILEDYPALGDKAVIALKNLREVGDLLKNYGFEENCKFDLSIVRGLAYYTDMVFEVFDKKKSLRSLFGGGRYDDLVQLLGGQSMPAVGFAIGLPLLEILMKESGIWPEPDFGPDFFVVTIGDVEKEALRIIKLLRKDHTVEYSLGSKNMSNQMNLANNLGAKKVIIIGERDIKEGVFSLKDMASGTQEQVVLEEFVKRYC
ncbi:MAG: histidine--tRNA ligase [Candidatus Methanofastidiosa archaeon]|nr:histidine--tRNA ligase [Candidatus Methanofastidiosa archaeon]